MTFILTMHIWGFLSSLYWTSSTHYSLISHNLLSKCVCKREIWTLHSGKTHISLVTSIKYYVKKKVSIYLQANFKPHQQFFMYLFLIYLVAIPFFLLQLFSGWFHIFPSPGLAKEQFPAAWTFPPQNNTWWKTNVRLAKEIIQNK